MCVVVDDGEGSVSEAGRSSSSDGPACRPAELAEHLAGVEAVLLDIDHTLVDTASAFARALGRSLIPMLRERRGGSTQAGSEELASSPDDRVRSADGQATGADERAAGVDDREIIARWSADPGDHYRSYTRGEVPYAVQRHARIDEIAQWLGLAAFTDAEYEVFARAFDAEFAPACAAFEDARPAVLALREAGVAVGAVSNASRSLQERKLECAGLADVVPLLVTVETFGVGKPDPRVFREGARLLGADPAATAYVGDEPDVDAQAAALAGLRGVLLRRPGDERSLERREPASDQCRYCEVGDLTGVAAAIALPTGTGTG
ncbi:HAD family hydrolase [Brachybacterium sp. MASK1Z-5]|uniref:HAD family hydrolase n=1 Tax=Brachybacterium halotolerans TaxID=2795215 RepID=A0ABS1B6M2_9MICO|nr:HAD family hydrolase [Brachybacterium halotolerans]MBK0330278.1 HAD family hydrolase [Brachybacterium halotolerans]